MNATMCHLFLPVLLKGKMTENVGILSIQFDSDLAGLLTRIYPFIRHS